MRPRNRQKIARLAGRLRVGRASVPVTVSISMIAVQPRSAQSSTVAPSSGAGSCQRNVGRSNVVSPKDSGAIGRGAVPAITHRSPTRTKPESQTIAHEERTHAGLALAVEGHALPHAPQ